MRAARNHGHGTQAAGKNRAGLAPRPGPRQENAGEQRGQSDLLRTERSLSDKSLGGLPRSLTIYLHIQVDGMTEPKESMS